MPQSDNSNPWANIATSTLSSSSPAHHSIKSLSTPSVVYSNSTQPIISFEGSSQPKNVINDVFLSSTMLYDDVERYLHESSSSFDSDSDSGFSTPSQHDEEHQNCFSTPMTPMSPFMENDAEGQLYPAEEEDVQAHLPEQTEECRETKQESEDSSSLVIDMKRPMFIPVSICDPRDFAAMASLPTPPECNTRKHSYDFLRNSDAFLLGGISASKRRRMETPASPPASNAGDDEFADFSDADSSAGSTCVMARRRSLFQSRHVRYLTPTSPSMQEVACFAPPTHEEYEYHPELQRSDDEDDEDEDMGVEEEEDKCANDQLSVETATQSISTVDIGVPSDLFVVDADQESNHDYMSEDNYSSSDEEAEVGYRSENEMQVDAMSSSDDSDSDLSDIEDYQFPIRRRGTWHGPSLEDIENAAAAQERNRMKVSLPQPPTQHSIKREPNEQKEQKEPQAVAAKSEPLVSTPAKGPLVVPASTTPLSSAPTVQSRKSSEAKSSKNLTLFQILTKANIDWCRYCGTTEGVNWRPGPWGKRTLCNKHGCDFKGYGFACKLPRLDLTGYAHETVDQRIRPVLQHFCHGCQSQDSCAGNTMVRCEGCPKAFHQQCHGDSPIPDEIALSDKAWFCDEMCKENVKKRRVCVELPKKRLPLMSTPKLAISSSNSAVPSSLTIAAGSATEVSAARPRGGTRASICGDSVSTIARMK
ncbi:hypothetical protein EMPS_08699 [Entomortierella parvispora]|uniref:PHD-type domain-containing protein n=1 Tax=Entomortierella parvispora TaxID=205924 RepID=A0A9P3HGV8_9FUNG|nr:hypothetical protein EMPS_08699 [Entomortierella parvispora]